METEAEPSKIVYAGDLRYVGDLSKQDAQILATKAGRASRILEFGVGASTQILAQVAPPGATVTAVETDPAWIQITRSNLLKLGINANVQFVEYDKWLNYDVGLIDLVFVDGIDTLRLPFAERAWRFLRVGGVLLIHDTRRSGDASCAMEFAKQHYLEIDTIELNLRASNITVMTKKNQRAVRELEYRRETVIVKRGEGEDRIGGHPALAEIRREFVTAQQQSNPMKLIH